MKKIFKVVRDSVPSKEKSTLFTEITRVHGAPYRFVRMAPMRWEVTHRHRKCIQQPHQAMHKARATTRFSKQMSTAFPVQRARKAAEGVEALSSSLSLRLTMLGR